MPKKLDKGPNIAYPAGCKELGEDLTKEELVRRLKLLARTFQDMGQDENNEYKQLALYLASEFFMEHSNKDVRLLVACCIADIFRIFAPEAPFTDADHLKNIFLFLTQQLRGLEDPESPSFKRYFYLLENLAWVKSFNICIELEDNQEVFCSLFKLIFSIVSEKHSNKVVNFMLDMMCPLITEADAVSQELLDIILINIVEPYKSQKKHAYNLAKDLIRRTANAIEPYIQTFFNNALMLGKTSESDISGRLYDLIYELNTISGSVLLAVLPQLEFKLKSSDEKERKAVTRILARMFSDPDSDLAMQNKPLWNCFLGRFNDIDIDVRRICVQSCQEFIVNQPNLVKEIAEPLRLRQHDADENVRMDVIQAVIGAARKELSHITEPLLQSVKERTLDKKFKIRKEALSGLGHVYKRFMQRGHIQEKDQPMMTWVRNKILHAYYQSSIDDRILVERLLNISLVPYSLDPIERMKCLYILYGNIDEHAVKALQEIFKMQMNLRSVVRNLLELHQRGDSEEVNKLKTSRYIQLARNLPEPPKAQEYMKKFNKILAEDTRIRSQMIRLVHPECTCKKAEECVREVLKKMGNPIPQNYLYTHVKMLLERVAPVMIDNLAIKALISYIEDVVKGLAEIADDVPQAANKGMQLLLMLSNVYPGSFQNEDVYTQLIGFVKHEEDIVSDVTLQIFSNIGHKLELQHPNIHSSLLPVLQKMVKFGTPKQAKHAIRCIDTLCKNKDSIFRQIFEHLQRNMDLESPHFLTSLVAIGHITHLCPGEFGTPVKGLVSKFIVKELLMQDRASNRPTAESWCDDRHVSEETQAKVQALKMMMRWLVGMKSNVNNTATSTLRLLYTLILHEGDLMERGRINKAEMARLRLQAGCCILKIAQELCYQDLISLEQFQTLALLLNDPCYQVRLRFSQKLHKGLFSMRLPLQYLSIFSLAANDPLKERRIQCKQFLVSNINRRRDYLKQHSAANAKIFSVLPDYALPYTIHLLAHDPDLRSYDDTETLKNIRECLWFMMEPLIKNESYSFSFYKKMIENIKQTKDAQQPECDDSNKKMYAVCDLALSLVLTKTGNFILKDFPAEPVLPSKLFTQPDPNYSNIKSYLPVDLVIPLQKARKGLMLSPTKVAPAGQPDKHVNGSPAHDPHQHQPQHQQQHHKHQHQQRQHQQREEEEEEGEEEEEEEEPGSPASSTPSSPAATSHPGPGRPPRGGRRPPADRSPSESSEPDSAPQRGSGSRGRGQRGRGRPPRQAPDNKQGTSSGGRAKGGSDDTMSPSDGGGDGAGRRGSHRSVGRPARSPQSPTSTPGRKAQGKITDFMQSSGTTGRTTPPTPVTPRGRGRPPGPAGPRGAQKPSGKENSGARLAATGVSGASGGAGGTITRGSLSPKARDAAPAPAPARGGAVRGNKRPAGGGTEGSSAKRLRGTADSNPRSRGSSKETVPSPSSSPAKSPSPSPKRGRPPAADSQHKRPQAVRANVRRAAAVMNGTSDGEEGTPESKRSSPPLSGSPRKRSAALAKAIQDQGEQAANVKRKTRGRRK